MALLTVVDHPAVAHRLVELRDADTEPDRFRTVLQEISTLLAFVALGDLACSPVTVSTPLAAAPGRRVSEAALLVPVLRAGLGMVPGVQYVIPRTQVAHLGMRRDEQTLDAVTYLDGLPSDLSGRRVVVLDPMLATGGSLTEACRLIRSRGAARVQVLCLVASQPGVEAFGRAHPEVPVTAAALDDTLNERGYIVPGLGDAGDRLFGPPPR